MGLDISGIVNAEKADIGDFKGQSIAIDGYNVLYQFLSSIRQPDGTPLQDSKGRITSHLSGAFYRTASLLENGIRPVYVFDGKPHHLKKHTLELRRARKEKAMIEWAEALEEGDLQKAKSKAQQTSKLTRDMVAEAEVLLGYMGVPSIHAPQDGEAQASFMTMQGDVNATASQDFDCLLFGAPVLVRNLTLSGRRKMPRRDIYVEVEPETIELQAVLDTLGITREQLVDIGVIMGTDFNEGVKGIGPKKGLKLIREFGSGKAAIEAKKLDIPSFDAVRKIFLEPQVKAEYEINWKSPKPDKIVEFLCEEYEFSKNRVESILEKVKSAASSRTQQSLDQWF